MFRVKLRFQGLNLLKQGQRTFHWSFQPRKPLKVAFFGSDEFSIASLKKLVELDSTLVESIEVIAKHPKYTGRDLKQLKDVPIVEYAQRINLPIVRAEKKSEILDLIPRNYSLAIAVSYGKLIPQQFIESVPHSLNVHPSLLPKYSGASPLHFALLNHDKFTGVTVQTLHPTEFDRGAIVDQTEPITIEEDETIDSLTRKLSIKGADLLAKVIQDGSYKTPSFVSKYDYSYASKISPEMREIKWTDPAYKIKRRFDALGPLYSFKEIKIKKRRKPLVHEFRRVLLFDIEAGENLSGLKPGQFQLKQDNLHIQTLDGSIVAKSLQFEFEKREDPTKFVQSLSKRAGETENIFTEQFAIQ